MTLMTGLSQVTNAIRYNKAYFLWGNTPVASCLPQGIMAIKAAWGFSPNIHQAQAAPAGVHEAPECRPHETVQMAHGTSMHVAA